MVNYLLPMIFFSEITAEPLHQANCGEILHSLRDVTCATFQKEMTGSNQATELRRDEKYHLQPPADFFFTEVVFSATKLIDVG